MRVKMPVIPCSGADRARMKAHRVGKRSLEDIIIAHGHIMQRVREIVTLMVVQVGHRRDMPLTDEHRLERPDRPERNHDRKAIILIDNSRSDLQLGFQIIAQ